MTRTNENFAEVSRSAAEQMKGFVAELVALVFQGGRGAGRLIQVSKICSRDPNKNVGNRPVVIPCNGGSPEPL